MCESVCDFSPVRSKAKIAFLSRSRCYLATTIQAIASLNRKHETNPRSEVFEYSLVNIVRLTSTSAYSRTIKNNQPVWLKHKRDKTMTVVKKTIELDQEALTRVKIALNARTEKEAINCILRQFDTDIQLAEATLSLAGKMNIDPVFGD